jgi:Tol biopolymer transport system component
MAFAPRLSWRVVAVLALLLAAIVSVALYAGSQQRRLPSPFGPAGNGAIPYVSGGDLYLGDLSTGTSRLLVGGPEDDAYPLFSPDGTRVAFIRDVGTTAQKPVDIYVVGADGSGLAKVTPEPIWNVESIVWTPDGRGLGVTSARSAAVSTLDIYDSDGSGRVRTVATAPGMDMVQFRPPDGDAILYRTASGLFVMDADGSNVRPILLASDPAGNDFWGGATWSADGTQVFYTRPYAKETPTGTCCSLWVVNADGSGAHQFIPNEGTAWDGQPTVSPDGTRVAFWSPPQVAVVPADGRGPVVRIGPQLSSTAYWVWSPDSSRILMFPNDGSTPSAYLLDPDGGPWTTVPWESDGDIDWQRTATD